LWPPQRGVGLQEPNLGKTNPRVTLFICLRFVFHLLSRTHFSITNANPACSCVYICKFQFRPIHPPPLGDYHQPSTSVTGQPAAGEGATVDTARNGPAVMAVAGVRKQRSSRQQAHVPSWDSERTLSHGVKTTRPCSVPRTARARVTAAPQTTRPISLTLRQDRRHLWQAKQATLRFRHNDRVKKGAPRHSISYPFPFPLSLSYNRDQKRGYPERDPSP
jgi:hypothetical protein